MGRVLCISSQTVYGPVGNSAAVPAFQAMGHEVMALPTVVLSNHPGHGKPVGQATPAPLLGDMLDALSSVEAFENLDAVLTGYFASAAQVIAVAGKIVSLAKQNQDLHVLVDPVIGDHGALYVAKDVAEAMRDHLLPLATITTPNLFELGWLSGETDVGVAVKKLNVAETIVTSIPAGTDLVTRLYAGIEVVSHSIARASEVPNGTGDYLAGCYLADRIAGSPGLAFEKAMERLERAISASVGSPTLVISANAGIQTCHDLAG
jgi:pyridoxine kinase